MCNFDAVKTGMKVGKKIAAAAIALTAGAAITSYVFLNADMQSSTASSSAGTEKRPENPEKILLDCGGGVKLELVKILAGTFMMGSPVSEKDRDNDEVQHKVTISKSFYMGIHEVTQAQYQAVMGTNPSKFQGDVNPVEQVSWIDAMEFCRRLSSKTGKNVRLPTEAEWEYACRAGTTTMYCNGNDPEHLAQVGNVADAELKKVLPPILSNHVTISASDGYGYITAPVGKFQPNAWELYDMHGNVLEWCSDWYGDYNEQNNIDPQGAYIGTHRVLRGGSWSLSPWFCRSAFRDWSVLGYRYFNLGFRIALDNKPE